LNKKQSFANNLSLAIARSLKITKNIIIAGDLNIISKTDDSTTANSHHNFDKSILDTINSYNLKDAFELCNYKTGPKFTYYKITKEKGKQKITTGSRLDYFFVTQALEDYITSFSTGALKLTSDHLDIMIVIKAPLYKSKFNKTSNLLHNCYIDHNKYDKLKKQITKELINATKLVKHDLPNDYNLERIFLEIRKIYKKHNLYKTRTTTPTTFPIDHKLQKLKKKVSTILKIKSKLLLFYSRVHKQQSSKPSKKPRLNNNSK